MRSVVSALSFILLLAALPTQAIADDFDDCARSEDKAGLNACTRAINSGQFQGRDLGTLYYNRGNLQEDPKLQIDDYTQAIRIRPDYASAYYNRGLTHREQNRLDEAIADYTMALRFEQAYDIYNNRGVAYARKREHDKAIADYSASIRIKPDYARAFFNRGNAYSDLEKTDLALRDYDEAIRLTPEYVNAFHNRGLVLKRTNRKELAIADFRTVLRLRPGDKDAISQLEQLGEKP